MSDNGSFSENSASNHDNAMEVDGGNQKSRPPSSPMMRSRFDHTNGGFSSSARGQSGQRNSGDFTITAGIGSHSPGVRRRGNPGFSGASVTTVVNGHPESDETVGASIMRPQSSGSEDARIRPNYQSQPLGSDRDVVGVITIGEARDHDEPNTAGQQGQLQEQQQQHQEPVPNFGNHNPVRVPEGPVQFPVYVKNFDGKTYIFQVDQTTLVETLMKMIQQRLGIHPDQQVLQFSGRNLGKGYALAYYEIREGATIFLTGHLRVPQGQQQEQQHQEPVPNFGNHNHVRAPEVPAIPEPQRPQQQHPQQQQHQRPLPNFGNCKPPHVPVVPITPEPPRPLQFQIHVKNFDGKTCIFEVERTTLVDALMKMIQQRLGIPPDQQVLQFSGQNLQKGYALAYYQIQEGSTIFLTGRLRGG